MHNTSRSFSNIHFLTHCGVVMLGSFCQVVAGAQNLVPNPSFEEYLVCPSASGFQPGSKPLYWEKWQWSPEYFHACANPLGSDSVVSVPSNGMGFQNAWHGNAYIGLATYASNNYREMVGCQLNEPLIVGDLYYLSFYASLATGGNSWNPEWASNNLGLLFTMAPNIWDDISGDLFALTNSAHLYSPDIITDSLGWVHITGTFIPDSSYNYLVIGNFFDDANTDIVQFGSGEIAAYYFIDDICVSRSSDCNSTEIDDLNITWRLRPNPVTERLHIDGLEGRFTILSIAGKVVMKGVVPSAGASIDISSLGVGMYSIVFEGSNYGAIRFVVSSKYN